MSWWRVAQEPEKSRTYAVPNILQCSQAESKKGGGCSIVVTDPKGATPEDWRTAGTDGI